MHNINYHIEIVIYALKDPLTFSAMISILVWSMSKGADSWKEEKYELKDESRKQFSLEKLYAKETLESVVALIILPWSLRFQVWRW